MQNPKRAPQSAELKAFLEQFTERNGSPQAKAERDHARNILLSKVQTVEVPSRNIQLVAFDMDHTMGLLYPISSSTGHWALDRMAKKHGMDAEKVFATAREVAPEFLCHTPDDFMRQIVALSKDQRLSPDTPANKQIMNDWRGANAELNKRFLFKGIEEGIKRIKAEGGMVYIATNAPPSNVFHRMFVWFGKDADKLVDGIALRAPLKDMYAHNLFACPNEQKMMDRLLADRKVVIVPHDEIKPAGTHLNYVLRHANDLRAQLGLAPVDPKKMVLVGDSLSSDGGAANNLRHYTGGTPAQFVYTVQGIVADQAVLHAHDKVGHIIDRLGPGPVLDKIASGDYVRPNVKVRDFREFFDNYIIENATNSSPGSAPVVRTNISAINSGYVINYKAGDFDDKRPWGSWVTTKTGYLPVEEGGLAYCDKQIIVKPGAKLSIQMHEWRKEHWEIEQGEARVFLGTSPDAMVEHRLTAGQDIKIPARAWHSIENVGKVPLVFKERQSGPYLDEGDNHRVPSASDPRTTDMTAISRIKLDVAVKAIDWPKEEKVAAAVPVRHSHTGSVPMSGSLLANNAV